MYCYSWSKCELVVMATLHVPYLSTGTSPPAALVISELSLKTLLIRFSCYSIPHTSSLILVRIRTLCHVILWSQLFSPIIMNVESLFLTEFRVLVDL